MSLWVPTAKCDLKLPKKADGLYQYGPQFYNILKVYQSATPGANIAITFAEGGWHEQGGFTATLSEPNPVTSGVDEKKSLQLHNDTGWTVFAVQIGVDTGTIGGGLTEIPRDAAQPPAFPRQIEQVEEAVAWIKKWAEAFNGNKSRIFLFGASAGGHIVSVAGQTLNKTKPGTIKAVVSLSGPQDLKECAEQCVLGEKAAQWMEHIGKSIATAESTSLINLSQADITKWIKNEAMTQSHKEQLEQMCAQWSPTNSGLYLDKNTCPRTYFAHQVGDSIVPSSQATSAYAKFLAAGITVGKTVVEEGGHGWAMYGPSSASFIPFCNAA